MNLKRNKVYLLLLTLFLCVISKEATALEVPQRPQGYVSDYAGLLSPGVKQSLEMALRKFELETTTQIVVATFDSLEGEALEDFSIRLAETWKVGKKGKDNGVLLLVFKQDKKIRIEVGYGLEGVLTDAVSDQIIRGVIAAYFSQGQFDQGIVAGVKAIAQAVQGEFGADRSIQHRQKRPLTPEEIQAMREQARAIGFLVLVLVVVLFVVDLFRYRSYRSSHKTYRHGYTFWEWWFRFAILLFVLNIVFRMIFYSMLFSRGGYYGSQRGFGGGGFSGGGGSFGGGGASGGW